MTGWGVPEWTHHEVPPRRQADAYVGDVRCTFCRHDWHGLVCRHGACLCQSADPQWREQAAAAEEHHAEEREQRLRLAQSLATLAQPSDRLPARRGPDPIEGGWYTDTAHYTPDSERLCEDPDDDRWRTIVHRHAGG